jgi:poly-beta-1,6-N-acetyl-D-glucosamine synthase
MQLSLSFLLVLFTLTLIFQFLGYPLLMSRYLKRRKVEVKDYLFQPLISVIVPTYNESNMIGRRISNLLSQNYPVDKFEIIIVDSGSKDDTLSIARGFEKKFDNLKVLDEGVRKGKASAINFGKKNALGEIILVTDANSIFNDDALREIAPHFKNPDVGAVGGCFVLTNSENKLVSSSSFYWNIESLMRRGESNFDSACTFHGEINAWRRDIVNADPKSLTEDLDMAIQIRRLGYRIVYEPRAIAYEDGPTNAKEQIIQKKRTTLGTIQSFFKFKKYLWLPNDKYSGLIFPAHKTLQIFSPYLLFGILATYLSSLFLHQFAISVTYLLVTLPISIILLLALLNQLAKIKGSAHRKSSVGLRKVACYVILHELIIILAWKDFFLGKYTVTWQKAETTRVNVSI